MAQISWLLIVLGILTIIVSIGCLLLQRSRHLAELAAAAGLFLVGIGIFMPNLHWQNSEQPHPASVKKSETTPDQSRKPKSTSSTDPSNSVLPSDPAVLAALNAAIANQLKIDQGLSRGTNNASGQAVKNGAPQHEYDWAMYLQSVTFGRDHRLAAHADALKVSSLVLSSRKQLATQAQHLALDVLSKQKLINNTVRNRGLYVALYADKTIILHSKTTNFKQFVAAQ